MNDFIDRMNYANDMRTQTRVPVPENLPTRWAICDVCRGEGRTVNPSIDAGGLCGDQMDDPEFMQDYMEGVYDISCGPCGGSGKVREIDRDRTDFAEQIAEYDADCEAEAECAAERRAEFIMGA